MMVWYDDIFEVWCAVRRGDTAVYVCQSKEEAQDYLWGWV